MNVRKSARKDDTMTLYIKAALLIGSISLASPALAAPSKPYATVGQWVIKTEPEARKCSMEALNIQTEGFYMLLDWSANSNKANVVLMDKKARHERTTTERFDILLPVMNKAAKKVASLNSKWKAVETYVEVTDGRVRYSLTIGDGSAFVNDVRQADALLLNSGKGIITGFLIDDADQAIGKLRTCAEAQLVK